MNIWIVTIGSSDVQLDSDNQCRKKGRTEKQRSDKVWEYWYEEVQEDCYDIAFEPKQSYKDRNELYRIEPRVLGMVYEASSPEVQKEIWSYLTFPLLDNFVGKLKKSPPNAIAVLLTDQSKIFHSNAERRKPKCPYWQDTSKLKLILKQYFQDQDRFPQIEAKNIECITLTPTSSDQGLDNWDDVLDLVDEKLRNLQINGEAVKKESVETVYVSHQAGTPAISSAVQFASLAQFEKVEFLLSNEYNSSLTELVPDSKYLRKLQREKAKQLLSRHDYSGVKALLSSSLKDEIEDLLDAAIQWNFAKFDDFAQAMEKAAEKYAQDNEWWRTVNEAVKTHSNEWWWTAYESAYLAVVRLEQGNTVEAMFHSFRAVEGLIRLWTDEKYPQYIQYTKNGSPYIQFPDKKRFNLFGTQLYGCLEYCRTIDSQNDEDIWRFGTVTFDKRNQYFHQLFGLQEQDVFKAWDTDKRTHWEARVLGCLNFIAEPKPPFSSLKEASLMSQVHQKLENAIAQAQYQHIP